MMKILLSILEILMLLGIITNYKLLKKKKRRKREDWLIIVYLIDRHKRIPVVTIKKECLKSTKFKMYMRELNALEIYC